MWRRCTPKNGFNFNQSNHTSAVPPPTHAGFLPPNTSLSFLFLRRRSPRLTLSQSFADGKRRQSQLFMRARVVAQGVTVAAMMGCLAWQGAQKDEKAASAAAASKITE